MLFKRLGLVAAAAGKLDPASNAAAAWVAEHLRVAIPPCDDRDSLGAVEADVVTRLIRR